MSKVFHRWVFVALASAIASCAGCGGVGPRGPRVGGASACVGLSPEDRALDPLAASSVVSVEALQRNEPFGKHPVTVLRGARIVIRAERGATAEWLARLLECHAARDTNAEPSRSTSPLVVDSVGVHVQSLGSAFGIELTSDDRTAAGEILRRARLVPVSPLR